MRGHTGVISPLILRGRGTTAHFEGRSVLLEQNGTHRRIPVRAIQEVRAAGARGDTAEIELTSAGDASSVEARLAASTDRAAP
jgi:hypothetical protein